MSFNININYPSENKVLSLLSTYNSINKILGPKQKTTNFIVENNDNCFLCSSTNGQLYVVLPSAISSLGKYITFVNVTKNTIISVNNLTDLKPLNNILSSSLTSVILDSNPQYFSILVSDGNFWHQIN